MLPDGIEAKDVKFLGVVQSYNEAKKFGMVASEEAQAMWGQEIYAYKDVLAAAGAAVGDTIRFGVHVNPRGQPQVSLPVFKIGVDGFPIGVPAGTSWINCEEAVAQDPTFLEKLKEEVEGRSHQQNQKRTRMAAGGPTNGGYGAPQKKGRMCGGKGGDAGEWGGEGFQWGGALPGPDGGSSWGSGGGNWGSQEGFQWGAPCGAGKGAWSGGPGGWAPQEVTLFVGGLPPGVERREVLHIFRQYAGFTGLRLVSREDHTLAFASFGTTAQAQFVADALNGYIFDEEAPPEFQTALTLHPAREKKRT